MDRNFIILIGFVVFMSVVFSGCQHSGVNGGEHKGINDDEVNGGHTRLNETGGTGNKLNGFDGGVGDGGMTAEVLGKGAFRFFEAYKEGDYLRIQFIFSDHEANKGEIYVLSRGDGEKIAERKIVFTEEDFNESAICTEKYCGTEKIYDKKIPLGELGLGYPVKGGNTDIKKREIEARVFVSGKDKPVGVKKVALD